MKRGGRFYVVDGKRVPEDEYRKLQKSTKSNRTESDSGKASTKQQRGDKA